jgi:mRNA interferase RelE/StbE
MVIIQSRIFEHKVRKFTASQKAQLDNAIREILKNPVIGEQKKGDLSMVYIYKFRIGTLIYLLAYIYSIEQLELLMIGPHENYYRDLKNYLKKK